MNFIQRLKYLLTKDSQARIAMSIDKLGQPISTPANYLGFSKEGYLKNAVVYRCIRLIATNCAGISWELYKGETEVESHPLNQLISQPNPIQGWAGFFESVISFYLLSGNSYIEANSGGIGKVPLELWSIRPDLMKIIPNNRGFVGEYVFKTNTQEKRWIVDPITFQSQIMHAKTFNPVDIWYGMSPLEAAMLGIDQYNQANRWNLSLLQNMASPSGVLKVATNDVNPTGALTNDQYARLKQEFYESHTNARNAGKPLILEGGVDWQAISLSPKEMDWVNSREVSATDIMNVFGVPAQLLGFGESTYANYAEAREALYEETILPLMDFFKSEFNKWLVPAFGEGLYLNYDKDDIEVLTKKREAKYTSLQAVNFLTQNEKRVSAGYEEVDGWDVFIIGNQILEKPDQWSTVEETPPVSEDEEGGTDDGKETSEEGQQEASSEEVDQEKGWKTFNLLNSNEKQTNWRRINKKRTNLEKPFARSLEQDFNELARDLEKAIQGKEPKTAEYAMQLAVDNGMKDISKTLTRYIKFTVEDFGQAVFQNAKSQLHILETKKNEKTWQQWADQYIKNRTGRAITEIEGTTRKQVRRIVQELVREAVSEPAEGEDNINVAKELRNAFTELSGGRARTIARTEVSMASNSATLEAAKSLEIDGLKKEWLSLQDDRTRDGDGPNPGVGPNHLDMNGVRVDIDDKFTVPPDTDMDGPGDPSAPAETVINCRCTLIFTARNK